MIKTENIGETLVKTYSDSNLMIKQIETGNIYSEAIDVIPCKYNYEETDVSIPDEELTAEEALNIIVGGDNNA